MMLETDQASLMGEGYEVEALEAKAWLSESHTQCSCPDTQCSVFCHITDLS